MSWRLQQMYTSLINADNLYNERGKDEFPDPEILHKAHKGIKCTLMDTWAQDSLHGYDYNEECSWISHSTVRSMVLDNSN